MSHDPQSVRERSVNMAIASRDWPDTGESIERARAIADYILGTDDAKVIDAAREFAKKVA